MRRLLFTAAAFQAHTGVAHFAIAPERIVITAEIEEEPVIPVEPFVEAVEPTDLKPQE